MSGIPPPEVYLQPDFDASSLKVAQLRGILHQYEVSIPAGSKKAELVLAFEQHVAPQGAGLLANASSVQPSNSGIISVAEDGTESVAGTGQKRGRGRPKKSQPAPAPAPVVNDEEGEEILVEDDSEPEPPIKKPRGRGRKSSQSVEVEVEITRPASTRKPRQSRRAEPKSEDEGANTETDRATPAPRAGRSRASMPSASPAISIPSAPSSSRRRSNIPSSVSLSSEMPDYEAPGEKTPLAKKRSEPAISFLDNVKEEDEPRSILRTPGKMEREDSGFSDFNPFQSGSEDAAERERRRRKSSIGLSAKKPAKPRFSEPAPSTSTPKRESSTKRTPPSTLRRVTPSQENLKTPPQAVREAALAAKEALSPEAEPQLSPEEQYNRSIQAKLNELTSNDLDQTQITISQAPVPSAPNSLVKRSKDVPNQLVPASATRPALGLGSLFLLLLSFIANYKPQSSSIGYCDSASSTNDIMLARQSALNNAQACIARKTALDLDNPGAGSAVHCDVSALPLVPFVPRPTSCTPCPQHALCEDGKVISCEPEYILTSHPLSILSPALDGMPGIGPRAFPPSCRPDTQKKRMIGGLAKSMEQELAQGRGLVVCAGLDKGETKKGQGEIYGMDEQTLRDSFAARRDPKFNEEQFSEIFEAALRDLLEHDDVVETISREGISYYAATRTELTLGCTAKLQAIDLLEQWKKQLGGTAAVLAMILYLQKTIKHRQQEKYKAEELVPVVLKRLQDQERLHYSDPVTTAHPFIPPNQLRDLVMPPKGSTTSRTRLWDRVQHLIEANSNVATREQEVRGELWKTWEWTGVGERHVTWSEAA